MINLDYNIPCYESVVVLGAGVSLNTYANSVRDYISSHESLVLGSNHNYPINSDFTLFTGPGTFKHTIAKSEAPNIIVTENVLNRRKKIIDQYNTKKFYLLKTSAKKDTDYWKETSIRIDSEGVFAHSFANCGFSSILSSHFFRPQEVVVVGFDGPSFRDDGTYQEHFHGTTRKWEKPQHCITKAHFALRQKFLSMIIEFLHQRKITIKVFGKLWSTALDSSPNIIKIGYL